MEGLVEEIKSSFLYDPETGDIYRSGQTSPAGCDKGNGYIRIRFDGKRYPAHRLAWLLHYGKWPTGEIDHINRIRGDNRIENLREVNRCQNMRNRSGVAGVSNENGRWRAYIWTNGKLKHLGMFACFGSAIITRRKAEIEHWGPTARTVVTVEAL